MFVQVYPVAAHDVVICHRLIMDCCEVLHEQLHRFLSWQAIEVTSQDNTVSWLTVLFDCIHITLGQCNSPGIIAMSKWPMCVCEKDHTFSVLDLQAHICHEAITVLVCAHFCGSRLTDFCKFSLAPCKSCVSHAGRLWRRGKAFKLISCGVNATHDFVEVYTFLETDHVKWHLVGNLFEEQFETFSVHVALAIFSVPLNRMVRIAGYTPPKEIVRNSLD